jgi:hypothetical protein
MQSAAKKRELCTEQRYAHTAGTKQKIPENCFTSYVIRRKNVLYDPEKKEMI